MKLTFFILTIARNPLFRKNGAMKNIIIIPATSAGAKSFI